MTTLPINEAYRRPIWQALALQAPLALLLAMMLDGGGLARIGACAITGFWCGTAIIVCRRPLRPTGDDLVWIRWGIVPTMAAAVILAIAKYVLHGAV